MANLPKIALGAWAWAPRKACNVSLNMCGQPATRR